jgi:hypothetical protein
MRSLLVIGLSHNSHNYPPNNAMNTVGFVSNIE